MIAKLLAILMSQETQVQIIERVKKNPRTSWVAVALVFIFGGAAKLYDSGFILASGLVAGVGCLVAVVALLLAADAPGEPKDPPSTPPVH